MNKTALILLSGLFALQVQAQKYWTLEECVSTGLKNNITMRQQELSKRSAESDLFQSKMNMLPNLNAQASNNWNTGFAINPVTNASTRDVTFRNNMDPFQWVPEHEQLPFAKGEHTGL
jgi:outer membrane protein